ncbi:hypothetical protein [Millisia brevis]|uniref:hypothetical protein n=1 Tax=Millisia brevis TaxID=264148 RepID=UPI0012ED8F11|nr:hypothetical protein [Millisia brevis]
MVVVIDWRFLRVCAAIMPSSVIDSQRTDITLDAAHFTAYLPTGWTSDSGTS